MISIAVTTHNRTDLLYQSFEQVLDHPDISEVVISDDCSNIDIYNKIVDRYKDVEKVKLFRNDNNLDCYKNKRQAVKRASNDWVILLDSDNVITNQYVDAIMGKVWDSSVILQPSFARPHFDFRHLIGEVSQKNLPQLMKDQTFQTMLNAMNYFVNRDEYLRVWEYSQPMLRQLGGDPVTSDSLYQNYAWLASGNSFNVVGGLEYAHRVNDHGKEEPSHYLKNNRRTPRGFHQTIVNKLCQL